ncbi:hypothetical protein Ahy_A05g022755 [Arachis hypogaea]|uniref:Uncharacterized protein n=1 Tax=Arachis hypogaea TaxID=3818 RepID=A0A445D1I4_ARAHY|nr:hypothetical protein Ahy_A05g022755 [Arachis hypogaea]
MEGHNRTTCRVCRGISELEGRGNDTFDNDLDDHMNIEDDSLVYDESASYSSNEVLFVLLLWLDTSLWRILSCFFCLQITSTNTSSILDPTIVVQSSKSTKISDLTSILPIQPKKLFHSNITREATTPPNGQPHVRIGAVLPKTLIAFEPTPSIMLTDSQVDVVAYIFFGYVRSIQLVITKEKYYRSTFRYLEPERCVKSRVINLVALMMALICFKRQIYTDRKAAYLEAMLDDHIFYDDKSKIVDYSSFWPITPFDLPLKKNISNDSGVWVTTWMREYTLQDDFYIQQINNSTRMRLAVDLVLEEFNDLCLIIQKKSWQYRTKVEAEHENIWE